METFKIQNLSFSYPEQSFKAIHNFSLSINEGEFVVFCGHSGCGKSTLLRQLKTVLTPHGVKNGKIFFEGKTLEDTDIYTQSQKIGFVQQSPESQIVTDKVWHEMAFGLESLGYDNETIRQRVAETAAFFGIENWFYKNVSELSGGQKQILNLASVMVMRPSVLILDEPSSQLDPIAASEFISLLGKINKELGVTVIITEHRLEEVLPLAERIVVMEQGMLVCEGTIENVAKKLREEKNGIFFSMPAAMRLWYAMDDNSSACPVTVHGGRKWFKEYSSTHEIIPTYKTKPKMLGDEVVLKAEGLWFKYGQGDRDIIKGLSVEVRKGELFALMGGNGTGKTTALKILSGIYKAYRGEVKRKGTVGILTQNPQTLFVKKTVLEDLYEILDQKHLSLEEKREKVSEVISLCDLTKLYDRHPYDLSGGEQQRAALAKILLLDPDILFMDEPTKGMDAEFKLVFSDIIKKLLNKGTSVIMVSHDIEFCAMYADSCGMLFDGKIISKGTPGSFFAGNSFYTTSANRIARDVLPMAITVEDVILSCGGNVSTNDSYEIDEHCVIDIRKDKQSEIPFWKKALALISGIAVAMMFLHFLHRTDLSVIIDGSGFGYAAENELKLQMLFLVLSAVFAFSISRKSNVIKETHAMSTVKKKLSKRTKVSLFLIILAIPLTLYFGVEFLGGRKYYVTALLILLEIMLPFIMIFEGRKPKARELVIIASMCAIGVAGRAAFFMFPQFKPVMAIVIVTGIAFGAESGFLTGAVIMLVSNMMFSQGPWLPWQMVAMGMIGFLSGLLYQRGVLAQTKLSLCLFGFLSAVFVYGGIMNPAAALMSLNNLDLSVIVTYCITGFPVDCVQGVATFIFLWFGGEIMLEKLERIKIKYGLIEQ